MLNVTKIALRKIKKLIISKNNLNLKLRIYILGGGCNGFKYYFILDDIIKKSDYLIKYKDIEIIIDQITLPYLIGGTIDYKEELKSSKFFVINPNAKTTCSCGLSFGI